MSSKIDVSIIIHTCSKDNLLANRGIDSLCYEYIRNLEEQTFKNFEFILVDYFYEQNKEKFKLIESSFKFKHVPVIHDYWKKMNLVHISSAKNSGICFAEGELLVSHDDCELFHPKLIETYWKYYKKDLLCHSWYHRIDSIDNNSGKISYPLKYKICNRENNILTCLKHTDKRQFNIIKQRALNNIESEEFINSNILIDTLDDEIYLEHKNGGWLFAGTSFSLLDAIALNGYNEKMDGMKALEDCDFGIRLKIYGKNFVMSNKSCFYILEHQADYIEYLHSVKAKSNAAFYILSIKNNEYKSNYRPLTKNEIDFILKDAEKYYDMSIVSENDINNWINTPNFDLIKDREKYINLYYDKKI